MDCKQAGEAYIGKKSDSEGYGCIDGLPGFSGPVLFVSASVRGNVIWM